MAMQEMAENTLSSLDPVDLSLLPSIAPCRYEQPKCDHTARAHPAKARDLYRGRQLQGEWAGWWGRGWKHGPLSAACG